jgi:phosphoribosylformimino-5-aminoimidazole carboxamide ribonucleotide (ProFAR) isomerase
VEAGRVRARGDHPVDLDLAATLGWLHGSGAAGFLVTAIGRVATESGPDLDLIRRVARAGRPTWAAGGIASVEHLGAVREAGAAGAIVGRAAMEGDLDLADAVAWAARG